MKTLRQIRKTAGISQDILAARMAEMRGGSAYQGPISAMERGTSSPTVKRLSDYLEALGFSLKIQAVKIPGTELNKNHLNSIKIPDLNGNSLNSTKMVDFNENGLTSSDLIELDLESLLGPGSRAKDTRKNAPRAKDTHEIIEDTIKDININQDPLESLILGILKK